MQYLQSYQKQFSRQEIEKHAGSYDKDGFYILEDNSFFDYQGFFFDKDGYDEIGGYYDPTTGHYVAPPDDLLDEDNSSIDDYYEELQGFSDGEDSEEEDEDKRSNENEFMVDEDEVNTAIKNEHC